MNTFTDSIYVLLLIGKGISYNTVTTNGTQYTYHANGNMTSDALNKNSIIKYDHRNLIKSKSELKIKKN
ncbi:MAG: hypothetical protein IPM38_04270 [Ignavibacteria bacterium]|nr:hypothetical protein [Ignavibacteria bacterium]